MHSIPFSLLSLIFFVQLKDGTGKYGAVQHCFPVYGGGLEVQGVDGILQVLIVFILSQAQTYYLLNAEFF